MNDINNSYDRWLTTPPDEPEASYCEYCGQEMELCTKGYTHFTCVNPFCPEKFDKEDGLLVHEMAEHLAEVEQELADLKVKYQQLKNITLFQRSSIKLTQSQSNVVVRDTEYAIKMVEDSIEYAYLDCGMSAEGRNKIWVNWAEVKKILKSYG